MGVLSYMPDIIAGGDLDLLCYYYDSVLVYTSQNYSQCYYSIYNGEEDNETSGVRIYPNPARDVLYIDPGLNRLRLLSIYDSQAKSVLEKRIVTSTDLRIDLHSLSKGFYVLSLIDDNHNTFHIRLIICEL